MARNFRDGDRDEDVVTAEGDRIGTIRDANDVGHPVTVDRRDDEGLPDQIEDTLGWDDDSNEIRNEHVDDSRDDEVRLRRSR